MDNRQEQTNNKIKCKHEPSLNDNEKILLSEQTELDDFESDAKRCCGMCGAGLSGNPCWKKEE